MSTLENVSRVLRLFTAERSTLLVSEASQLLGLPKSSTSRLLKSMARLQDGWVKLARDHGLEVTKAAELEATARDLVALREKTLNTWPWASRGLPPVDRDMVANISSLKWVF